MASDIVRIPHVPAFVFNNYSASYGSLGAAMILLVWLYVSGLAYLIGGEVNAEIGRAGRRVGPLANAHLSGTP